MTHYCSTDCYRCRFANAAGLLETRIDPRKPSVECGRYHFFVAVSLLRSSIKHADLVLVTQWTALAPVGRRRESLKITIAMTDQNEITLAGFFAQRQAYSIRYSPIQRSTDQVDGLYFVKIILRINPRQA